MKELKYLSKIQYEELRNVVENALQAYTKNEEQTKKAELVIDILLNMLAHKNQIRLDDEHYPGWVDLLIAAGYIHNLFYDGTVPSLFEAREKLTELCHNNNVPINGMAALFQSIEGQLGDQTPVQSCIPPDGTPNGLFAWACFFADYMSEEHNRRPLPNARI